MFNIRMYVCCCRAVTDREIETQIAGGAHTVEAVMLCTRAGTGCGACRNEIAVLVEKHVDDHRRHLSFAPAATSADLEGAEARASAA